MVALLAACAVAGALSAAVLAANGPFHMQTTGTESTTTGTTTTPTETTPTTTTPRAPSSSLMPADVSIAGEPVGGLTASQAKAVLQARFRRPLVLRFKRTTFLVDPTKLGAPQYLKAVRRARAAQPGADVPLSVVVRRVAVRRYVERLGARFDRKPLDSRLVLRRNRPWLTKDRPGRRLDRLGTRREITRALVVHRRAPVGVRARSVRPTVTRLNFGPVVVIRRESKQLELYRGMRLTRRFGVATGQSSYPTPIGRFSIVVKARHPWWYPPNSAWARDLEPVPPGPGNPLGTRWMGLSAWGVGIHGTPDAASIGYSASHGCIRMRISEAEWLFNRVGIGTTVFIVSA